VLSIFDQVTAAFHTLAPAWRDTVLGWDGTIDLATHGRAPRRGLRRFVPSRYPLVMALERWRLSTGSAAGAWVADALQRALLAVRPHQFPFTTPDGGRLALVPFDMAVGPPIALGPSDVILSAGFDWSHKPAAVIADLKRRHGFRYAVVCYDIIPILFPEYYSDADVAAFTTHWRQMFAAADLVLCISHCVAADVRRWCAAQGIALADIDVAPLGCDPPRADAPEAPLPAGLADGHYVLFVSTIEPRKGHAMLLHVWQRLLEAGIPQRHGFRLVFVGRPGWMVDDLLAELRRATEAGTVLHLSGISDDALTGLYRHAAFCVYPSRYEGFGLPLIEAFAHGKAVISSTGGALPEVAAGRAPCVDPEDAAAWQAVLGQWIEDPAARAPYEARIRAAAPPENWDVAAARMLDRVAAMSQPSGGAAGP